MQAAIDFIQATVDFILHIDDHLFELTRVYGAWVYGVIFLIVFAETGLVVTPILPGDSLLFAAGALCGAGLLNPVIMGTVLLVAAIIGDAVNYSIGRSLGPKVFSAHDQSSRLHRMLNREHLDKALRHLLAVGWAVHLCYSQNEAQQVMAPVGDAASAVEFARNALEQIPKKPEWSQ